MGARGESEVKYDTEKMSPGQGAPGTPDFNPLMLQRGTSAHTRSVCPVGSENQQQSGRWVDTPDLQLLAPEQA